MAKFLPWIISILFIVPSSAGAQTEPGPTAVETSADDGGAFSDADIADIIDDVEADVDDGPSLNVYGFLDFSYGRIFMARDAAWNIVFPRSDSFGMGNLNIYFNGKLSEHWQTMVEIRFSSLPHGDLITLPDSTRVRVKNVYRDLIKFGNETDFGSIRIERAWGEFRLNDHLIVRAGQFLTPFGVWNVDHGSPTVVPIAMPFTISYETYPFQQTGLEILGSVFIGSQKFSYILTVSNGTGLASAIEDLDFNKALGYRLTWETDLLGELTLGTSGYYGRYGDRVSQVELRYDEDGTASVAPVYQTLQNYKDLVLGADLTWHPGGKFLLQAELVVRQRQYHDAARPVNIFQFDEAGATQADMISYGMYALMGYRFDFLGLMPFFMYEEFRNDPFGVFGDARGLHVGLNARVHPAVVLKAAVGYTNAGESGLFGTEPKTVVNTQAAFAF